MLAYIVSSSLFSRLAQRKVKKKDLLSVDHSQVKYDSFRKNFYTETTELKKMTDKEAKELRSSLDIVKIKVCPHRNRYIDRLRA